jgi:hypothetical protein
MVGMEELMSDDNPPDEPTQPAPPANVPGAAIDEQIRHLASLLADLHKMLEVIHANRGELLPGEAQDEFDRAWTEGSHKLRELTDRVLADREQDHQKYIDAQLTGNSGSLKKSMWQWSLSDFRALWHSEPRTSETRQRAQLAAAKALDITTPFVDSIPMSKPVVELMSATKFLLEKRANRVP